MRIGVNNMKVGYNEELSIVVVFCVMSVVECYYELNIVCNFILFYFIFINNV